MATPPKVFTAEDAADFAARRDRLKRERKAKIEREKREFANLSANIDSIRTTAERKAKSEVVAARNKAKADLEKSLQKIKNLARSKGYEFRGRIHMSPKTVVPHFFAWMLKK